MPASVTDERVGCVSVRRLQEGIIRNKAYKMNNRLHIVIYNFVKQSYMKIQNYQAQGMKKVFL
jgi:hypothetical protein